MKKFIGVLFIILGVLGGLYVGGVVMFVQPIIYLCQMIDAKALTVTIVGITFLKCFFATVVGIVVFLFFGGIGGLLLDDSGKPSKRKRI